MDLRCASRALALSLVCCAVAMPWAGAADGGEPIRLRSGAVHHAEDAAGLPEMLQRPRPALRDGGTALVRFSEPVGVEPLQELRRAGARIAAWLDPSAAAVTLERGGLDRIAGLEAVGFVAPYHPGLRIAPEVAELAAGDEEPFPATVHLLPEADVNAVAGRLAGLGLQVAGRRAGAPAAVPGRPDRLGRVVLRTTAGRLAELRETLARWPEVFWIGRRPAYRLLNDDSTWVGQAGLEREDETPIFDRGLRGEGQIVAVLDTGIDADMCFFREEDGPLPPAQQGFGTGSPDFSRRKIPIVSFLWEQDSPADPGDWDDQGHGTHVAGTIAGDDLATIGRRDAGDGMAPAAQLVVQDGGYRTDDCADLPAIGCPAASLEPFFQQAYDQGARIHSNSYGDRENSTPYNVYSDGSEDADRFMWDNPDFLLVFAAGNNGPGADTVASPATAKNVLAVGATRHGVSAGALASFSSQGNTHDDRIKPDVTVPGQSVVSARNDFDVDSGNCGTSSKSGTSMACPTAAGLAALVRQYYEEGFYPAGEADSGNALSPSAALVKSTVLVSATPMEEIPTPPPSLEQGWGRILLDDALYFPYDARRLTAFDEAVGFAGPSDDPRTHEVRVLDETLPLRAVLTWTDAPSNPAAEVNLVNDLDLTATSPSGTVYRGNVLVGGASEPGGDPDRVNNVEVVRVEDPEPGLWTLEVSPHAVPVADQGYALTVTGRTPAPGVVLERISLSLDDSVGGDGDGVLEPGEWIDLPLTLLNSGDTVATQVRARVSSPTPHVQIAVAETAFPDLSSGESAVPAGAPLRVHLTPDFPCGGEVELEFRYLANGFDRLEGESFSTGTEVEIVRDDFESETGWTHVPAESTARTGDWLRGDPNGTRYQPEDDVTPAPGVNCLFTAQNRNVAEDDVDDGVVVARSGRYDLSGHPEARLRLSRWFDQDDFGNDPEDFYRLSINDSALNPDVLVEEVGGDDDIPRWTRAEFRVADYVTPGPNVQLKVEVSDGPTVGEVVEGAIDEVVFFYDACDTHDPPPNRVTDLSVATDGQDAVLEWSRPGVDPAHGYADRYRVHRSTRPDGDFAERDRLSSVDPSVSWTDAGAAGTDPGFYAWFVVSANSAGAADAPPAP